MIEDNEDWLTSVPYAFLGALPATIAAIFYYKYTTIAFLYIATLLVAVAIPTALIIYFESYLINEQNEDNVPIFIFIWALCWIFMGAPVTVEVIQRQHKEKSQRITETKR